MEVQIVNPTEVYQKSKDKQRVVITGSQARRITAMVIFVLQAFNREFDWITAGGMLAAPISDAPLIIIEHSDAGTSLEYHHHIAVLSEITGAATEGISRLADATPKGGVLIYTETEPVGSVGKKERPDITVVPYKTYPHTKENGTVSLLSGQDYKTVIKLSSEQDLRNLSAAGEILKKVGIASSQFHQVISGFQA